MLHAVWYEDQVIQLLKFSMSQEVKKGPLAALTFESSKNFIITYFQKIMWFYLLAIKNSLLGKVWGKTFSDAKYLGPLLQRSPLNHFPYNAKWLKTCKDSLLTATYNNFVSLMSCMISSTKSIKLWKLILKVVRQVSTTLIISWQIS